jgi:uncharacterized membrane protein YgdD (TMEM256/DUF423 family)
MVDKFESPLQSVVMTSDTEPSWMKYVAAGVGFTGVALGAFGAHALKPVFAAAENGAERAAWWQTGVQYHLVHAVLLVAVWALWGRLAHPARMAGSIVVGVCLFSGSLYLMALTSVRLLGAVTPLGGVAFLAAWLHLLQTRRMHE